MTVQLELDGLTRITQKVKGLGEIDFVPLMKQWEDILHEDNRAGALAGLDGKGKPLAPVRYRPLASLGRIVFTPLANNNLTASHYRSLDGPPLAPRRENSRIITNFRTSSGRLDDDSWQAVGAWEDVLSVRGLPFLRFHFKGSGRLPKRDLRGVRPSAVKRAREALRDFMRGFLSRS